MLLLPAARGRTGGICGCVRGPGGGSACKARTASAEPPGRLRTYLLYLLHHPQGMFTSYIVIIIIVDDVIIILLLTKNCSPPPNLLLSFFPRLLLNDWCV